MSTKITTIISIILIVCATLAGLLLWNQLPDPIASHWNINNQVDGTMPKFWGVFLMPLLATGIFLLLLAVPSIDPLKSNIDKFRNEFNNFIVMMMAFLMYVYGVTLVWNLGYSLRMSSAILPGIGLLFYLIGNMLSQAKRNYFIGIRTPWTLASDTVWDETHRVGSILFKAAGFLTILGVLLPSELAIWLLIPLLGAAFLSVSYSYIVFRRETHA